MLYSTVRKPFPLLVVFIVLNIRRWVQVRGWNGELSEKYLRSQQCAVLERRLASVQPPPSNITLHRGRRRAATISLRFVDNSLRCVFSIIMLCLCVFRVVTRQSRRIICEKVRAKSDNIEELVYMILSNKDYLLLVVSSPQKRPQDNKKTSLGGEN